MTEWISVSERLPKGIGDIVMALRENKNITKAYYHQDEVAWVKFYGVKTSIFQDHKTKEFLFDVTHWMPLPQPPKE